MVNYLSYYIDYPSYKAFKTFIFKKTLFTMKVFYVALDKYNIITFKIIVLNSLILRVSSG